MMPTATTVPLILLVLFLWRRTKGNVLSVVLFTSVFAAASAANFGGFGLSPPLFALVFCLLLSVLKGHGPVRFVNGINRLSLYLLIAFTAYATATSVVYPFIFEGVLVMHGATDSPLAWSMSNFAQICYLLASLLLYFIAICSSREQLQDAISWYIRGCVVSTLIAVYQLANAVAHVPYPDSVLYSNPSHVIYRAYMINGLWRLNSTFSEASEFSACITVAIGLLGWQAVTRPVSIKRFACLGLMIIMLLMTVSSLGYVCLLFTFGMGLILYTYRLIRRKGLTAGHLAFAVIALTVLGTSLILSSSARQTITKLVRSTLVDKKNSDSYRDRTETQTAALSTLEHTFYLGAGWGSVRASGLAFVLLGNVGLLGSCIFLAFCISLLLPLLRSRRMGLTSRYDLYEQCLFALGIMLLGLLLAGAEPVQPILWVMFGIATAAPVPIRRRSSPFLVTNSLAFTPPEETPRLVFERFSKVFGQSSATVGRGIP